MRRTVSSGEVPHLWMHQAQDEAKNSNRSLYFRGDTIYSYGEHFPIARHVRNKKGQRAVLFNSTKYSVTTSSHQSAVRCAIPEDTPVFEVPRVTDMLRNSPDHKANLAHYTLRVSEQIKRAARARSSSHIEFYLADANKLTNEARLYCKFFGLKVPKLERVPKPDAKKLAAIREREKKAAAELAAQQRKQREEYERQESEEIAKFVEEFRAGRDVSYISSYYITRKVGVMLRIEGNEVVTSMGARVPVSHAARALKILRAYRAKGETYQRNGHTIHIGHYSLDSLDASGVLKAGCHVISWDEVERLAPQLEAVSESGGAQ